MCFGWLGLHEYIHEIECSWNIFEVNVLSLDTVPNIVVLDVYVLGT